MNGVKAYNSLSLSLSLSVSPFNFSDKLVIDKSNRMKGSAR